MKLTNLTRQKVVCAFVELRKPLFVLAVLWGSSIAMLLTSESARAALRCDCTQVVESCSATVSLDGMSVGIESDSDACSRVDYLIDGQPFAALVVGGSTSVAWPGQPLRDPQIVVENCRVCAEADDSGEQGGTAKADADEAAAAAATERAADAIVKIMPSYPRDAWTNDVEGDVTVKFDVSDSGAVENIRVVSSNDAMLSAAAVDAVSRFRFTPALKEGQATKTEGVQERFSFRILAGSDPVVNSATL